MDQLRRVATTEVRVLDGPNLYFTRPAIKLTLNVRPWLQLSEGRTEELAERTDFKPAARAGSANSEQRRRFVARLAAHLTRVLAEASHTSLAVRARPGAEAAEVLVAFPWRPRLLAVCLADPL